MNLDKILVVLLMFVSNLFIYPFALKQGNISIHTKVSQEKDSQFLPVKEDLRFLSLERKLLICSGNVLDNNRSEYLSSRFAPRARISGKVYSTLGIAISSPKIELFLNGVLFQETEGKEDGSYEFQELPAGEFTCKIKRSSVPLNIKNLSKSFKLEQEQHLVFDIVVLRLANDLMPFKSQVAGKVKGINDEPVNLARVKVIDPYYQQVVAEVLTDISGDYKVTIPMQGQFLLQVFYPGYQVNVKPLTCKGEDYSLDFKLRYL